MEPDAEMNEAEEVISVLESLSAFLQTDEDLSIINQVFQNLQSLVDACQAHHKQVNVFIQGLHETVKAKEQHLLSAQKANLKDEELEELTENLAQALLEKEKARATAKYVSIEEHLDGLAEQLQSVESQKQTLASLATEEVRLKNELSLFSTISGIIPDLSQSEVFAGTLLDEEDVTPFSLDRAEMSPFELSKSIWDMIRC